MKDKTTLIYLKSTDVLHSFFLPQMRIKQDAVPGLTIPVWFDSDRAGELRPGLRRALRLGSLQDARGNVTVHETQSEFDDWMQQEPRRPKCQPARRGRRPSGRGETTMSAEHAANGHGHGHAAGSHGHGSRPPFIQAPSNVLTKYVFSTDHKVIGIQFLISGLLFFVLGGLPGDGRPLAVGLALVARADLEQGALVRPRSATGCRRNTTTSCSRCTRRS